MRPENPRFPHTCTIVRRQYAGPLSGEADEVSVYSGPCRVYDKNTTSDKGDVITSYRGLALPITRDEWERLGVTPRTGDRITVDRGGCEEYGEVIDVNAGNFGGTHCVWKYGRN